MKKILGALLSKNPGKDIFSLAGNVIAHPDHAASIQDFSTEAQTFKLKTFHSDLKKATQIALASPHIHPQILTGFWYNLLSLDPDFYLLLTLISHENYEEFIERFPTLSAHQNITSPLFLQGLRTLVLPSLILEKLLTNLRRILLEDDILALLEEESIITLAASLAQYCFYTAYIFNISEEEKEKIASIEQRLDTQETLSAYDIARLACYKPLHTRPDAHKILQTFENDAALGTLMRILISEPLQEKDIAATIPRLTVIEDKISQDVQQQYIEFPYPRWQFLEQNNKISRYFEPLEQKNIDILIAGCGTGQEVMSYHRLFPKARILALDLSPASLSYAIRKTGELGVKNVEFQQADILALPDALDKKFDLIVSSGVLHHMENPEKGFTILDQLLKPDGFMRICLYSKTGRRHIIKARNIIAKNHYGDSAEEMRRFRRNCHTLLSADDFAGITKPRDFYILPQCRDLLFHVMEHQFDIPRIQTLLKHHGYEFLEFTASPALLQKYQAAFPDDPQANSLENWHDFETRHPDTFEAMYKFVCRKKISRP